MHLILFIMSLLAIDAEPAGKQENRPLSSPPDHLLESKEFRKSAIALARLEETAVSDLKKPIELLGEKAGFARVNLSILTKRLGAPVDFVSSRFLRPSMGRIFLVLRPKSERERREFEQNTKFFALQKIGGIRVVATRSGDLVSDGWIYLEKDNKFPLANDQHYWEKRFKWEQEKIEAMRKWLGIPKDVLDVTDEQLQKEENIVPKSG